jgi:hypothetical protein
VTAIYQILLCPAVLRRGPEAGDPHEKYNAILFLELLDPQTHKDERYQYRGSIPGGPVRRKLLKYPCSLPVLGEYPEAKLTFPKYTVHFPYKFLGTV